MAYQHCTARLIQAAGRALSDDEVRGIYERIHRAALDLKAGRARRAEGGPVGNVIEQAAQEAARALMAEAALKQRQAHLQVTRLAARVADVSAMIDAGMKPLDAVEKTIVRDYSGRANVESLEQRAAGHRAYFGRRLLETWEALGSDWLGFFQSREKLLTLVRELRGEATGDALAAKGAKAFHDVAEEARTTFNAAGGDIGRLDDWGMPQHHSQERVAAAGRDAWVDATLPLLDRARYADDLGQPWTDAQVKAFLSKAWDTIATNGHANREPGQAQGTGKRANRHGESRQIHFKDAESVISYWEAFGEKTAVEILTGHVETMAKDIAFVEHFGPNPDTTFRTLRDLAVQKTVTADATQTTKAEARAVKLEKLFDYVSGRTTTIESVWLAKTFEAIANLNVAGKLGGAAIASLFGDKPMMEAVRHLNNLPAMQAWRTELSLLNPANAADRRLLQRQGLMLDMVRSGLQRFGDTLGQSSVTGKLANGVMRLTGMSAINEIRKGAFGAALMDAIGHELAAGKTFAKLADSDVRTLRNYGITENDWRVWQLAKLEDLGSGNGKALTPDAISRISDDQLRAAGAIGAQDGAAQAAAVRRDAVVKLLGAVNTESEFAIVTPGWKERATFYSGMASERGTVPGEIWRSFLQFKSFPWAMFQRSKDAIANGEAPASKAAMTAYLVVSTTLAGAMLIQTREMLSGKDPLAMTGDDWWKFWAKAFLQGGALGIYGDFLYGANQTRYGSGILETVSGPTLGPLLELGLVQPMDAAKKAIEGKETHLAAKTFQDLKGWVPGGNVWYAKAALDHLVWQQVMEGLSPGYLSNIRSRTLKEYRQDWWWTPGEVTPERAPDLGRAFGR